MRISQSDCYLHLLAVVIYTWYSHYISSTLTLRQWLTEFQQHQKLGFYALKCMQYIICSLQEPVSAMWVLGEYLLLSLRWISLNIDQNTWTIGRVALDMMYNLWYLLNVIVDYFEILLHAWTSFHSRSFNITQAVKNHLIQILWKPLPSQSHQKIGYSFLKMRRSEFTNNAAIILLESIVLMNRQKRCSVLALRFLK